MYFPKQQEWINPEPLNPEPVNAYQKRYKAVKKAVRILSSNPRHNTLKTHEFTSLKGPEGEKVFEAYAGQATPAAYRIFWYYGPDENQITVIAITPHS